MSHSTATPTPSRIALALATCLLATALFASSAGALALRGHTFHAAFGSPASDGQLSEPTAVAVSEASSDVYVLDRANNRIERFDSAGNFISAWGWGVGASKKYEVCTAACHAGTPGIAKYQLGPHAVSLAVDNCRRSSGEPCSTEEDPSVGDVYLATEGKLEGEEGYEQIDKFTAQGEPLETVNHASYLTAEPLTVPSSSEPKQREKEEKQRTKEEKELTETEELESESFHGLTVAPDGTVWVYYEADLYRLSDAQLKAPAATLLEAQLENAGSGFGQAEPALGIALDAAGNLYLAQQTTEPPRQPLTVVSQQKLIHTEEGERLQLVREELDGQNTTALAADQSAGHPQSGELYLDRATRIDAVDHNDTPQEQAGAGNLTDSGGVAIDAATRDLYATDAATDTVVLLEPAQPGAPSIDALSTPQVASAAAVIDAQIDPDGAPTTYTLSYGTPAVSCAAEPDACTTLPAQTLPPGPDEGFGALPLTLTLDAAEGHPLAPATTYHYLLTASNAHGQAQAREASFHTLPQTGHTADARVWELVSPPAKSGAAVEPQTREGGLTQAAVQGGALTYLTNAPVAHPEGSRSFEVTQDLATRSSEGWSTQDLVTPNQRGGGLELGVAPEYQAFSANLSLALLQPFTGGGFGLLAEPPLTPAQTQAESGHQQKTVYLRANAPIEPEPAQQAIYSQAQTNGQAMHGPGYLALLTGIDAPGAQFGGETEDPETKTVFQTIKLLTATPDLTHVALSSLTPLTPAEEGRPAPSQGVTQNLYEWAQGRLQLISISEDEGQSPAPAYKPTIGNRSGTIARGAISADGTRIVFSGGPAGVESGERRLYMRDTATQQTLRLDLPAPGVQQAGIEATEPEFQGASQDGSTVLFTDQQRLTPGAGAEAGKPDLYACHIVTDKGHDSCQLSDLTPEHPTPEHEGQSEGESADVQGLVLGYSADASYVYFVADGVLASGAPAGRCGEREKPAATCDLYQAHRDPASGQWQTHLVAVLSEADRPDWLTEKNEDLGKITAAVSPNGRYVTFMSQRRLTGYDNEDATSTSPGERLDQEVFVNDAQAPAGHQLICASCDPSGARPHGVLDPLEAQAENSEGLGLLVDRNRTWAGHWLAASLPGWTKVDLTHALYQPRFLSDTGRLFFDSPESLVAQDLNGKEDVYEYEPQGVPSGPHQCTASSETYSPAAEGCVGLISSGTSTRESAFLDASQSGGEAQGAGALSQGAGDVFFITSERLTSQDSDGAFDVYDAHECTSGSPCLYPPTIELPKPCESDDQCRAFTEPAPSPPASLATSTTGPSSNLSAAPQTQVLPSKSTSKPKPKPLTRAQKLTRALKACRTEHRHSHKKRSVCERAARAKYAKAFKTSKRKRKRR